MRPGRQSWTTLCSSHFLRLIESLECDVKPDLMMRPPFRLFEINNLWNFRFQSESTKRFCFEKTRTNLSTSCLGIPTNKPPRQQPCYPWVGVVHDFGTSQCNGAFGRCLAAVRCGPLRDGGMSVHFRLPTRNTWLIVIVIMACNINSPCILGIK